MRAMLWPSCWECFLCSSPAVNFALGQEHTSSLMAETNQEAERLTAGPTVMPPALPSRPSRGRPPRAPQGPPAALPSRLRRRLSSPSPRRAPPDEAARRDGNCASRASRK
jgi:hypothetical protein